ncbi:9244_t:CDS:2 [Entrophospora sp. SA101]|nr:9244_t:CDS:2 [Entrophospora sp. SA101]
MKKEFIKKPPVQLLSLPKCNFEWTNLITTSHEYDHINYNTKPHHHRIRRSSATTKFVRFATIIDDVNHDADDSGSITSSTCSSIDGDDFDVEGDEFFFPNSDFVVPSKIS